MVQHPRAKQQQQQVAQQQVAPQLPPPPSQAPPTLLGLKQELLEPAEHNFSNNSMLFAAGGQSSSSSAQMSGPSGISHPPPTDPPHAPPPTRPPPAASQPSSSSSGQQLSCTVCGDVATGRHYGSVACNGCKGFFRRTIRRGYKYTCRFNSNCHIDKHNRAVCRACRYTRCIQFGMKVDAVQSERDLIGKRARTFSNSTCGGGSGSVLSPESSAGVLLVATTEEEEAAERGGGAITEAELNKLEQQRQMDSFDSATVVPHAQSPCSSAATASVPSHFMAAQQHQPQFSSVDSDEPVPRKRSFSSGSKNRNFHAPHTPSTSATFMPPSAAVAQQQSPAAPPLPQPPLPQQQAENSGGGGDPNLMEPWSAAAANSGGGRALLRQLLCSEEKIRNLRETVIAQTCNLEYINKGDPHRPSQFPPMGAGTNGTRKADENDILQSLHSQLLLVIEWAKTLKPFAELPTDDQTALLKNFAAQHVVLCVAYRSTSDFLKLINDSCIPRIANGDDKDLFYRKDAERVMDLLVSPMRFLRIDDVEFVAMKACILFNPVARGLSPQSVMSVLQTRRLIFRALQQYVRAKMPPDEDRIGDLTFFILSPLQSLAKAVSEDVLVSKLSGVARLDQLMEELILEDNDPKEPDSIGGDGGASTSAAASVATSVPPNSHNSDMVAQQQQQQQQQYGMEGRQQHNHHSHLQQQQQQVSGVVGGWATAPPPQHHHVAQQPQPPQSQQRARNLSSSASSSAASANNSPPLGALQQATSTLTGSAGCGTPATAGAAYASASGNASGSGSGGSAPTPLSTINEAEFSSSALSSYVFGGTLHGGPPAPHHPPPPHPHHHVPPSHHHQQHRHASHHPTPPHPYHQYILVPHSTSASASASSVAGGPSSASVHSHGAVAAAASPSSTTAALSPPPHPHIGIASAAAELWAHQIGANLVYSGTTAVTPGPAIYSGTSPSPPQRFGIGGGGMRPDQ